MLSLIMGARLQSYSRMNYSVLHHDSSVFYCLQQGINIQETLADPYRGRGVCLLCSFWPLISINFQSSRG